MSHLASPETVIYRWLDISIFVARNAINRPTLLVSSCLSSESIIYEHEPNPSCIYGQPIPTLGASNEPRLETVTAL